MAESFLTTELAVAIVAIIGSLLGLLINTKLEHRLTTIEVNSILRKDWEELSNTINLMEIKLGFLWNSYRNQISIDLKNPKKFNGILDEINDLDAYNTIESVLVEIDPDLKQSFITYLRLVVDDEEEEGWRRKLARDLLTMRKIEDNEEPQ